MNHVPHSMQPTHAAHLPLKGRALAKLRTREKVLQAARRLFVEHGFEATTIRGIAAAAGMSTGAVFASFADKAELFNEILISDVEAIHEGVRKALATPGSIYERLLEMFRVAYTYNLAQLPLLRTGVSESWTRSGPTEQRNRDAFKPILDMTVSALKTASQQGELSMTAPFEIMATTLWELHIAGYRGAIYDGKVIDDLVSRLGSKMELILAGGRR